MDSNPQGCTSVRSSTLPLNYILSSLFPFCIMFDFLFKDSFCCRMFYPLFILFFVCLNSTPLYGNTVYMEVLGLFWAVDGH